MVKPIIDYDTPPRPQWEYVVPRAWVIESAAGVILTHYAAVAAKYELSPLHVVTPYRSKLP